MKGIDTMQPTESVDGVTIQRHNQHVGSDRRPLVLLNGIGHGHYWGGFIGHLHRPVITLDVRESVNYTNYPWPLYLPWKPRFDLGGLHALAPIMHDYVDRVDAVLDHLGHDRVDVMGFSWGGLLAAETALSSPQRIGKLVIAASAPGKLVSMMDPAVLGVFFRADRHLSPQEVGDFYGGDLRTHPELYATLDTPKENNPHYYRRQLGAAALCSFRPQDLQGLHTPTLIMSSDDDPIIPPETTALFTANLPVGTTEHHVERGGGHLFILTRPKAIAARTDEFLGHAAA